MALDVKLLYFFNNFAGKSQIFDALVVFLASYVQVFLIAGFLLLLYFSAYSKRKKLYIVWVTAISIIIARMGVTELIRFFYDRPRPFLMHELHQLISKNVNTGSFPSGHSAFFFAMATAIYFYNKKWGVGFFIAAILMNVSRIVTGVHYPSDILGGMVVGVSIASIVFFFTERKWKEVLGAWWLFLR
jgi:undecaprenyl-diphosphatase